MVLDAIFSPISALPSITVLEAPSTAASEGDQPKDTGAPVVAPEPTTDTVEISPQAVEAEGGALVADSPEMAVARIAPWPPRPEEGSIGWLLDNLREGVYFTDLDRRVLYWSKGAERISGFPAAEVVGRRCSDNILTHVDQEGCALCAGECSLKAAMEDGEPRDSEIFLHHKNPRKDLGFFG